MLGREGVDTEGVDTDGTRTGGVEVLLGGWGSDTGRGVGAGSDGVLSGAGIAGVCSETVPISVPCACACGEAASVASSAAVNGTAVFALPGNVIPNPPVRECVVLEHLCSTRRGRFHARRCAARLDARQGSMRDKARCATRLDARQGPMPGAAKAERRGLATRGKAGGGPGRMG